jgi:hypothetical protein
MSQILDQIRALDRVTLLRVIARMEDKEPSWVDDTYKDRLYERMFGIIGYNDLDDDSIRSEILSRCGYEDDGEPIDDDPDPAPYGLEKLQDAIKFLDTDPEAYMWLVKKEK